MNAEISLSPVLQPPQPPDQVTAQRVANRLSGRRNSIAFVDLGGVGSSCGLVFENADDAAAFMQLVLRSKCVRSEGYGDDRKLHSDAFYMNLGVHILPDTCLI